MRRIFAILILLCVAYFAGGWLAVSLGWLSETSYFSYAGLVGGLASVLGLLSFAKPSSLKADLREVELESLKSIAKTSDELMALEQERAKTKEALEDLEIQKKEMELSVKKASLALFLKNQYEGFEKRILDEVRSNVELSESLNGVRDTREKLTALEKEIESDPNVSLLRDIMATASERSPTLDEALGDLPPIPRVFTLLVRELSKALSNTIKIIR